MRYYIGLLILIFLGSCSKYQEIADASYPEQDVYMPASVNGVYDISVVTNPFETPTPNPPTRYTVDEQNNRLVIPLGIFRGGLTKDGDVNATIAVNDTLVSNFVTNGFLEEGVVMLPTANYSFPSSANISGSQDYGRFDVLVDLNYISDNPDQKFAFAVSIADANRTINEQYRTVVVLIDPAALGFSSEETEE